MTTDAARTDNLLGVLDSTGGLEEALRRWLELPLTSAQREVAEEANAAAVAFADAMRRLVRMTAEAQGLS